MRSVGRFGSMAVFAAFAGMPGAEGSAQTDDGTGEDAVTEIVADGTSFEGAWLHLPASGVALDSDGIWVSGLLVGFERDLIPFAYGENEVTFSRYGMCDDAETMSLVLTADPDGVEIGDMQLLSSCREVVSWAAPAITPVDGAARYYRIELAEPETRDFEGGLAKPAMGGTVQHVRATFESEPPGSQIWVNDELLEFRTDVRLSIPYMSRPG